MIVVTGGAGFIGSRLLQALNAAGHENILVVDDLTDGEKYTNLLDSSFYDYQHHQDFLSQIANNVAFAEPITAIFHLGACSVTTEWDGRYMMKNNFSYSKVLFHYCADNDIPFIYASSAAVYGANDQFLESDTMQRPLNVYGFSKWAFDCYVRRLMPEIRNQVVGLRYFNVYGPNESHKGDMASVAYHFTKQLEESGKVKLFEGTDGYDNGEQRRDFIYVDDVAKVTMWFLDHDNVSGIYNVGTGNSRSFNDLARSLIDVHGGGKIDYIPMPEKLSAAYQSFTEADLTALREAGYEESFTSLEDGIAKYYAYLSDEKTA